MYKWSYFVSNNDEYAKGCLLGWLRVDWNNVMQKNGKVAIWLFIEVRYLIFLWLEFVHVLLIICLGTVTESGSKMHLIESNKPRWMLKLYVSLHN